METSLNKALNLAYFYLRFRPRTKWEVIQYLQKKSEKFHLSSETIDQAIAKLEEQNYINDKEFIRMFVEKRILHKPRSAFAIKLELQKFGVEKDLIDTYFQEQPLDQDAQALHALAVKWPQFSRLDKKKRFEKAANFLARRGFSFDIIKKTIAQMEEKE